VQEDPHKGESIAFVDREGKEEGEDVEGHPDSLRGGDEIASVRSSQQEQGGGQRAGQDKGKIQHVSASYHEDVHGPIVGEPLAPAHLAVRFAGQKYGCYGHGGYNW
jgi:hypothetical protein